MEIVTFEYLEANGVDGDLWPYYVGYVKQVWERMMKFTDQTLALEILSLQNEYVLRGLALTILQGLTQFAEYHYQWKMSDQEDESLFASKFKVGLTADQIVNPPMQVTVQFDNKTAPQYFDTLDEFNVSNSRFEPKNPGYYFLRAQLFWWQFPVGMDHLLLMFRGNGGGQVMQVYKWRESLSLAGDLNMASILLFLPAGYYVEVQAQHNTGAPRTLLRHIYGTLFEGFRVG